MKTCLSIACFALALVTFLPKADAQTLPYYGGTQAAGGAVYEPAAFQATQADFQIGLPGRVWLSTNIAGEDGLGFEGTYATIGGKTRLFEDALDGRWLMEARGHVSAESGGFFGNLGIERIFTVDAAGADISLSGWLDYDDDQQGSFAHTFFGWGISGAIKTRKWDLIGNGYFPEGTTDFSQGDPTGVNCFLDHGIVLQAGIDSALRGYDVTLRTRPKALSFINGSIDFGGYGYESDLVEYFGGGRGRVNMQLLGGLFLSAEINYDDRFEATGSLNLTWIWGVNARGSEYAGLARDLERTTRNDHIVRFNQEVVLALDPDTGRPYNVFHVDNSADPNGDGTVEAAFTSLAEAEAASGVGDIIFVREGDGTTNGLDTGIQLQDDQLFLADGVQHFIPIQNGQNFLFCNDVDGIRPTITGSNNGAAVTLANNNVVRGFNIDGSQAPGGMQFGIFGDGLSNGGPITNGLIEDNIISGAILHGVFIDQLAGDWTFRDNNITGNGFDGILLQEACDPNSIFLFENNNVSGNGRDGIHIRDYDAAEIVFNDNQTDANGRNGVFLENFKNSTGNGLDLTFLDHVANGNNGNGIEIQGGDGNLQFLNSQLLNNLGAGLRVVDWTNNVPGDSTFIGITDGGTSNFMNNGFGLSAPGVEILQTVGQQTVTITDSTLDGNGIGVLGRSEGVAADLTLNVVDNISIMNSGTDGLRFIAADGARLQTLVEQSTLPLLPIMGSGGAGISFLSGVSSGGAVSVIEAVVRNVSITGSGLDGVNVDVNQDGGINLLVEDSTVSLNGGSAFDFFLDTNGNGLVNTLMVNNITAMDNFSSGVNVNTLGGTLTDLVVTNSLFANMLLEMSGGINADGISVVATGNNGMGSPEIDNRTRVFLQGNTIDRFTLAGINILSAGDASLFADIDGNNIGPALGGPGGGPGGGIGLLPPLGAADLPHFSGIEIAATQDSLLSTRVANNVVNGYGDAGLDIVSTDNAALNASVIGNNLAGNDIFNPVAMLGPPTDDFRALNLSNTSSLCLSMSNNFFTLGAVIANAAIAPGQFPLELDGFTNGFGAAIGVNTADTPFGSTCLPAIQAEEAAFAAAGFPAPNP